MISKKQSETIKKFLAREIDPAFARRARIILENLDIKSGMKILEVGCGRGFYEAGVSYVYPDVSIIGVDLNEKYLEVAKKSVTNKNVTFLRADATELPFPDETFDRVICTEVLEHVSNDTGVLKEIYRVLKPKGLALITVPNKNYPFFWDPLNFVLERLFHTHIPSHIWWLAGIWADHVRLYTESELLGKLGRVGKLGGSGEGRFKVEKIWRSTAHCLPFSHFLLYGVGKNVVELGLGGSFNRFSFESKPNFLIHWAKKLLFMSEKMNEEVIGAKESFLNIIISAVK